MFLIPVVTFIFTLGMAWNPKTEVTLITDMGTEETVFVQPPLVISKSGDAVLLVEAKAPAYSEAYRLPFRRTSFGDITVDCQTNCHEALDK